MWVRSCPNQKPSSQGEAVTRREGRGTKARGGSPPSVRAWCIDHATMREPSVGEACEGAYGRDRKGPAFLVDSHWLSVTRKPRALTFEVVNFTLLVCDAGRGEE